MFGGAEYRRKTRGPAGDLRRRWWPNAAIEEGRGPSSMSGVLAGTAYRLLPA
ncbi:hypothetical protein OG937_14275 [Streptomyces sp. NBC_00510]